MVFWLLERVGSWVCSYVPEESSDATLSCVQSRGAEPAQISRCQSGNMKQAAHWEPANITRHCPKVCRLGVFHPLAQYPKYTFILRRAKCLQSHSLQRKLPPPCSATLKMHVADLWETLLTICDAAQCLEKGDLYIDFHIRGSRTRYVDKDTESVHSPPVNRSWIIRRWRWKLCTWNTLELNHPFPGHSHFSFVPWRIQISKKL